MYPSPYKTRDKVAIVGFATSSRDLTPYGDDSFEIWGLNELYTYMPRWNRWFEVHDRKLFYECFSPDNPRTAGHLDWLKKQDGTKPIYMVEKYDDIPASVAYPYDDMMVRYGNIKYYTSSIAYMLALAIAEGYAEIHVYGVDMMMDDEYAFQRSCCDFFLGVALGMGRRIFVPWQSALLKSGYLYGREADPVEGVLTESMLTNRIGAYQQQHAQKMGEANQLAGAIQELTNLLTALRHGKRGGALPGAAPSTAEAPSTAVRQIAAPAPNGKGDLAIPTAALVAAGQE